MSVQLRSRISSSTAASLWLKASYHCPTIFFEASLPEPPVARAELSAMRATHIVRFRMRSGTGARLRSLEELQLPGEVGGGCTAVLEEDLGVPGHRVGPRPVALQLCSEHDRRERHGASLDHALNGQFMSFDARSPGRVRDEVDVVPIPERMQDGKGKADLRPEGRHDHLLATGLLDPFYATSVFPGIDLRAVDRDLV